MEGEEGDTGNTYASGDKENLEFPASQQRLMEAVLGTGKPVIVCNFTGSAMNLSLAEEKARAVIQAWYPGAQGGKALARILFGEVSPSGKLPVTFYRNLDALPAFEDYSMEGRTYRYLTEKPLYPFGYGMTYGDVQIKDAQTVEKPEKGKNLKIRVAVKNEGGCFTKDVLQVYVRNNDSEYAPLHPALCMFTKLALAAGEEKSILLEIPKDAFYVVDENGEYRLDSRSSTLYVGTSAPCERSMELTGKKPVEVQLNW